MERKSESQDRSRPLLLYVGAAWSAARSLFGIFALIGWTRLIEFADQQIADFMGSWFIAMVIHILAFSVLSIAILARKNWGRLGFLLMSVLVFVWTLFRVPIGLSAYRAIYPLAAILLGSWLFNQSMVLSFFHVEDIRPSWFSRRVFGIQLDLALALGLLGVGLVIEIMGLVQLLPTTFG